MATFHRIDASLKLRGRKHDVRQTLRNLPRYLTGSLPDVYGIGRVFKLHYAVHMLRRIHAAFLQKSQGGTDDLGNQWKPLAPSTIAQKAYRTSRGRGHFATRSRGLLTPAQNRQWSGIFKSQFLKLAPRIGPAAAKAQASKLAWGILKAQGAQTVLSRFSARKVPINIDKGPLERSLRPGFLNATHYNQPANQKLETHRGYVTLGSKLPYAPHVHKVRPLWPDTMQPWHREAVSVARDALVSQLTTLNGREVR